MVETGVRLQRELVMGNMRRLQGERRRDVRQRALHALVREREHDVQVEIVEARAPGLVDRGAGLGRGMDAPERCEGGVVEALRAQRYSVDPGRPVRRETAALDR